MTERSSVDFPLPFDPTRTVTPDDEEIAILTSCSTLRRPRSTLKSVIFNSAEGIACRLSESVVEAWDR